MNTPPLHHPSLARATPVDALRLIRSENVGPVTFFNLLRYYGDVATALDRAPELAQRGGRKRPIAICSKAKAEDELAAIEKFGATMTMYGSDTYPPLLHTIDDPPPVLTIKGHASLWRDRLCIAMVGARNASQLGLQFARKIASDLGQGKAVVVSGLARGIDTAAHHGALASGTVAVIAGGIDNIYPPENAKLYEQIRESGTVISEQPFGAKPHQRSFPSRNRIIAGMSSGTLVVEASHQSGSLITARNALDYDRDVFAVPGSPLDPRCKGTNGLLKDGAILTESAADIFAHAQHHTAWQFGERNGEPFLAHVPTHASEHELARVRALVAEKLGASPVLVDELVAECHLPAQLLLPVLLEMELAGTLFRHAGGKVSRNLLAELGT